MRIERAGGMPERRSIRLSGGFSGDGNGRRARLENSRQRERRRAALWQRIIRLARFAFCWRLENNLGHRQRRSIHRHEAQARQAAFDSVAVRHVPLAGFLMPRRAITETQEGERTIEPRQFGRMGPEKRTRQSLDQERIGNEQPHDEAPCLPPFLTSLSRSRHGGSLLPNQQSLQQAALPREVKRSVPHLRSPRTRAVGPRQRPCLADIPEGERSSQRDQGSR